MYCRGDSAFFKGSLGETGFHWKLKESILGVGFAWTSDHCEFLILFCQGICPHVGAVCFVMKLPVISRTGCDL